MQLNKRTTLLLIAGTGLALTITACAGKYCHRDPEKHSAWLMEEATEELKLDKLQQASLRVFVDEVTDSRKLMRSQRKQSRETLMEMLAQSSFDRDRSFKLVDGHIKSMQVQAPKLVNAFADFYDGLNPEQRKELREELDEHFDRHHRKHHW